MGFHVCEYCKTSGTSGRGLRGREAPQAYSQNKFSNASSGDVTLTFDSGQAYQMPDMILHYVADHNWRPPEGFILDVMERQLVVFDREQTRGDLEISPQRIGYLTGGALVRSLGQVPVGFVDKLMGLMRQAGEQGDREQTRTLKKHR